MRADRKSLIIKLYPVFVRSNYESGERVLLHKCYFKNPKPFFLIQKIEFLIIKFFMFVIKYYLIIKNLYFCIYT